MAMKYDAFISYAHGVATPIAQAIRNGISKYNKKWNKAVSTKVYLDEKSLGVAPSLTDELEAALGCSGWLVLLLTRRAAEETSWVGKEVEYWLENKSADRMLLVACEGKIEWDEAKGDFSDNSDCIPRSLRGRLEKLPCWMDLSWFGVESDSGSPRFQDAVIALYSRVHEISPDEARMANDSNLRRNRRLAKGAIIVLSALLVVSIIASIAVLWQTQRAQERERVALALAMSAKARTMANENVRIASLLAVQAYRMAPSKETKEALHEVAAAAPRLVRMDRLPAVPTALAAPPKGDPLIGTEGGKVYRWIVEEGRFDHVLSVSSPSSSVAIRWISSDWVGQRLLVQYGDKESSEGLRCLLWSAAGEEDFGGCQIAAISPDGKTYIVNQVLYGEKIPNGKQELMIPGRVVAVDFSGHGDEFAVMKIDGSWERRQIAAPDRVGDEDVGWFGIPDYGAPNVNPDRNYQAFSMSINDEVWIRGIYPRLEGALCEPVRFTNSVFIGTSPSRDAVFSAGGEGIYWRFKERGQPVEESRLTPPELLAGLTRVKFAAMANDDTLVGVSETHIARWNRAQVSRIASWASLPVASEDALPAVDRCIPGIRPSFSPDGSHVAFCYPGLGGVEMVVFRLRDMHLIKVKIENCVLPKWSVDSAYVAAAQVDGEPQLWVDIATESVVQPVKEPELVPQSGPITDNLHDESVSADLVRNGREIQVVDKRDQAVLLRFIEPHGRSFRGEPLSGSGLSPDGRYFFSASFPRESRVKAGEEIQVWMLDTEEVIQTICRSAMTPLSPEEWAVAMPKVPVPETLACS
ncbi:MAG: hypothetical protein Q4B08_02645 [Propionibacteriaceae bacterium]|nr:hypothetical protein [Propionibacteriaceae bacterium]